MTTQKSLGRKISYSSSLLNISFFDQIAIVLICVLAMAIALTAHVGLNFYKDLKEDNLKNIQFHRIENIKNRLEYLLSKDRFSVIHSRVQLPQAIKNASVRNLPEGQERVVLIIGEAPFILGANDERTIWIKPLTDTKTAWNESDGFTYLITNDAKLVATNTPAEAKKTLEQSIKTFFSLKLNEKSLASTFTENSAFKNSLISHSYIDKTNLILVNEVNVSGYLTFFKNFSSKMYLSAIMGAILFIGLAIFFEIRFVRAIEDILALVDNLRNVADDTEPKTKLLELDLLFDKMSALSRDIYLFEDQYPVLESLKIRFSELFSEISKTDDKTILFPKIIEFTADVIQNQHGKISVTLYEFPHRFRTEIHGQNIATKFRKISFISFGVAITAPQYQRILNEGFNLDESKRFCFRGEPELLTESEARFPLKAGEESIGFLLFKGDRMENMNKHTIEWIMLSCQLMGYCFKLKPDLISIGA